MLEARERMPARNCLRCLLHLRRAPGARSLPAQQHEAAADERGGEEPGAAGLEGHGVAGGVREAANRQRASDEADLACMPHSPQDNLKAPGTTRKTPRSTLNIFCAPLSKVRRPEPRGLRSPRAHVPDGAVERSGVRELLRGHRVLQDAERHRAHQGVTEGPRGSRLLVSTPPMLRKRKLDLPAHLRHHAEASEAVDNSP